MSCAPGCNGTHVHGGAAPARRIGVAWPLKPDRHAPARTRKGGASSLKKSSKKRCFFPAAGTLKKNIVETALALVQMLTAGRRVRAAAEGQVFV
jgi:hypothetical protein